MNGIKKFIEQSDRFFGVAAGILKDAADIGAAGKMTTSEVLAYLDIIYKGQQSIKMMNDKKNGAGEPKFKNKVDEWADASRNGVNN